MLPGVHARGVKSSNSIGPKSFRNLNAEEPLNPFSMNKFLESGFEDGVVVVELCRVITTSPWEAACFCTDKGTSNIFPAESAMREVEGWADGGRDDCGDCGHTSGVFPPRIILRFISIQRRRGLKLLAKVQKRMSSYVEWRVLWTSLFSIQERRSVKPENLQKFFTFENSKIMGCLKKRKHKNRQPQPATKLWYWTNFSVSLISNLIRQEIVHHHVNQTGLTTKRYRMINLSGTRETNG